MAKKPTLKEKIEVYEALLFSLNYHRTLTEDQKAVEERLKAIDEWVNAHSPGAIGLTISKEESIASAFEKLRKINER